ncbi:GNAT family N-acetyltransferase [Halolamina salifodinae]|uniref:GNAT superfamily N-acetyltransferase n=1 Tax=Halolamina salifodinae TaxID=1202767 RepID=A0A8T4GYB0_9EURY|nr:GNAT family N-acetyltransferase [Halolamina salifodinae]MBP1988009.1 GNAT superfamily N-acetyltransferase [Halolamina salifodinae]
MADVSLRAATIGDADALAAAYRSAYAENRDLGFPAKAESATAAAVREWVGEQQVFVAETDEGVVGGVRLGTEDVAEQTSAGNQNASRSGDDAATISRLGVRERWKGEGIGSRLLERAERAAREAGHTRVRLTTPDEHPFLPEFYHAHGYEITGDYPLSFREYDEVVMEKSLE